MASEWHHGADMSLQPASRARPTPRRWHLDNHGLRRIGSKSRGFHYETAEGRPISDSRTLERIRKLRIPPAWREVRIARSDSAPLQAIGIDKKGRTQYRYHPRFRQKQDEAKFVRVVHFAEKLPALRSRVRRDLARGGLGRKSVLATIVRLLDQGFFRLGNEKSAKHEETFGITTFRKKHARVSGAKVSFEYVGKWQKKQTRSINDVHVARVLGGLQRLQGSELFKYAWGPRVLNITDRHVNDYIQKVVGEDFTAKDFRTWAGTLLCSIALAWQGQAGTQRGRKQRVKKAIESTARLLGNTPAVCRTSYISPRLIAEYMDGRPFEPLRKKGRGSPLARVGLSPEEKALVRFFRETIADRRKTPRAA